MDLLDSGFVNKIISDIQTSQNKERREAEIKALEIYSGELKTHVLQRIKKLYPKTWSSFTIADVNLLKKITDKKAKSYQKSPIRELESENETDEYVALMKECGSIKAWQTFDTYYNLHKHAAMWFSYDGDRIILRPLNPSQFSRVTNNFGDTQVFIVNFPSNDMYITTDTDGRKAIIQDSEQDSSCERYALWTKDQHVVIRYYEGSDEKNCRIVYESIDGNENNINPLGIIPAVFAQAGDNSALPILNPLPEQTIEYGQQYSVMLTGCSVQTFGHLVLKHPEDQKMPDEIYNSLFTYSRLPQIDGSDTSLEYLNSSPNIQSNLDVLRDFGGSIVSEHLGDGSQNIKNQTFTSGLDRLIAQSDITSIIESNQQVYADCENSLYKIIRAFYFAKNDFRFRSDSITVKYPKPKPIQSESELLANIEKKIALGLMERHEALMTIDPNMSKEAAIAKIEQIDLTRNAVPNGN